jgi:hypothetical protein
VLQKLKDTSSSYIAEYERRVAELHNALAEAKDNVKFLSCLRRHLETLRDFNPKGDITLVCRIFRPLFHLLMNIWQISNFYNINKRMVCRLAGVFRLACWNCAALSFCH